MLASINVFIIDVIISEPPTNEPAAQCCWAACLDFPDLGRDSRWLREKRAENDALVRDVIGRSDDDAIPADV